MNVSSSREQVEVKSEKKISSGYTVIKKEKVIIDAKQMLEQLSQRIQIIKECANGTNKIPESEIAKLEEKSKSLLQAESMSDDDITTFKKSIDDFRAQYIQPLMRLSASEINALLGFFPDEYKRNETTKYTTLTVKSGYRVAYVKCDKKDTKNIYTFSLTKDNPEWFVECYTPLINDVVEAFLKDNTDKAALLLLPLHQCNEFLADYDYVRLFSIARYFGVNLKKHHCVLVEIDLAKKTLDLHDSRGQWKNYFPDTMGDVAKQFGLTYDATKNYHRYETQQNDFMCGHYVNEFCKNIVIHGDSTKLKEIVLDQNKYESKLSYLREALPFWGVKSLQIKDSNVKY